MTHAAKASSCLRIAIACLGLSACADNAVLEVTLELPARTGGAPVYAFVQSRSDDMPTFDGSWAGADASEGFPLGTTPTTQHVSFVASGAAIPRKLGIRVRFCADRACGAIADVNAQEAHFIIDRAFYRGQRTSLVLPAMPSATPTTTTFTKCQVAGCTMGTTTTYCFATGRHFCE